MQQLTQKLGSGEMLIQELPYPQVGKGMVLVKNHYSIISAGTEGSTVSAARKSLIGKAKERPQQVKQVWDTFRRQGLVQTYRAVMKKLDAYSPLGYSCAGEVIEVGEGVTEFKAGDLVACAGAGYANHAEIVCVPINLCVLLKPKANLKQAAYNTLGAIALQGVRQADLRLGESCAVIGLGLLGQLTCQLLQASGVYAIAIDVSEAAVHFTKENHAAQMSYVRTESGLAEKIMQQTNGNGVDAVIIAAATTSTDPVNLAGEIARKKGKVVVLGAVSTGFDRDPFWYRKELELKMACSYGPGRYDLDYEEKGIDYPYAYVRWTEKRNMEAFQALLESGKITIDYISTHEFEFEQAKQAFDMVVSKSEPYLGIVLRYDVAKQHERKPIEIKPLSEEKEINLSFIGAGSYAQGNLLPNIPSATNIRRVGVLTNSGTSSKRVAEKFGFSLCTSNESDIFNSQSNTVFIATRHNSHASYVQKALENNMHVFVEKPLCLNEDELDAIINIHQKSGKSLMVGFNRRFSPLVQQLKKHLGSGPMSMLYRINAGAIPKDSWIQDMEIGGGRLIGEVCHFIDLLVYLNGSLPQTLSAISLPDPNGFNDTISISIQFENGSIGTISYFANGSKELPKEYLEVYQAGTSAVLNDFNELTLYGKGKPKKTKLYNQNKGQKEMVEQFFSDLTHGKTTIELEEIVAVTKATFLSILSLQNNGARYIYERN